MPTKVAVTITEEARPDPTTIPAGEGHEYQRTRFQAIADRNDIANRPEGTAVVATRYIAACPVCGFHLQYIFDSVVTTKVIPLNSFAAHNRSKAGLRPSERAAYNANRGVICPRCRSAWRVPAPV